jgi:hypothetical protein
MNDVMIVYDVHIGYDVLEAARAREWRCVAKVKFLTCARTSVYFALVLLLLMFF